MQKSKRPQKRRFQKKDEFESKLLDLARIARMTAGGRRFRFRALMIVGDMKGKVGFGIAKGEDVSQAIEKATKKAKKNLVEVPIEEETIPCQVEAKCGAARVLLKPQSKGRGLVAGGTVRTLCLLAGIKNISSKIIGKTANKVNNTKATIAAFKKLESFARKKEK